VIGGIMVPLAGSASAAPQSQIDCPAVWQEFNTDHAQFLNAEASLAQAESVGNLGGELEFDLQMESARADGLALKSQLESCAAFSEGENPDANRWT
jgi:hypothetical protein